MVVSVILQQDSLGVVLFQKLKAQLPNKSSYSLIQTKADIYANVAGSRLRPFSDLF